MGASHVSVLAYLMCAYMSFCLRCFLCVQSFADGFGLQTPLVNGQLKVIRYHPYYDRCIIHHVRLNIFSCSKVICYVYHPYFDM